MATKQKKAELPFEEALEALEGVVTSLEEGDVPLAELVEQYERGKKLLKTCEKHLNRAELKISKLQDEGPKTSLVSFEENSE